MKNSKKMLTMIAITCTLGTSFVSWASPFGLSAATGEVLSTEADIVKFSVSETSWAEDSKGWWIQNSDGSYLKNTWYRNVNGKWHYMGADGYMLVNTTTPDGYRVGADGAWIQ